MSSSTAGTQHIIEFLKPQKLTLAIFAILLVFAYYGSWFGGALITAPVYPIVSNFQVAVGADTSETESYVFRQFQYGVQLPIYAIFVYLVSCWGVFIFKNIGGVHHSFSVLMMILLFLLYLLPFALMASSL